MNISTLDEEEYRLASHYGAGRALDVLWDSWRGSEEQQFDTRKEVFLKILERLLEDGQIKLHKNGVFLQGAVQEQIEVFRRSFPSSEADADRQCTKPGREPAYEGFGMNVWWFLDICPAGVAWRTPDGAYQIAD